ncbi:COPI associated protein-domain-containing protein [Aspergillus aurantiobrunneus]
MKYKAPEVQDGQETDDVNRKSKRKRAGDETPVIQERSEDEADLEPPSKATRAEESPGVDEDDDRGFLGEEGEFDEGDLDEDLSEEGDDEGYDEVLGVAGKEDVRQKSRGSPIEDKLQKTIEKYGRGPLEGTAIAEKALTGSADTILAMLIDAMLKSRPISHELTDRTLRTIIDAGYHDVHKLGDASWEERAMVLKDGGYNRYREQGSTNLGKLVELVNEKYEGDLNNLLKNAEYDPQKTRQLVKEIHGLGDLGVELFFNNVQSVWPSIAPFVDSRSLQTAEDVGIGSDLNAIYANLNKDSVSMCKLANAFRFANIAVGVIMLLGGIAQFFPISLGHIITGVYVILFGIIVAGLEFLPNVPDYVYRYASFLFSFLGRGVFYIFVGCLILHGHVLQYIAGSIVGFLGIGYVVLEFVPSIEPPSNMREADQGWGAEQVV